MSKGQSLEEILGKEPAAILLRTDFSDDEAWTRLAATLLEGIYVQDRLGEPDTRDSDNLYTPYIVPLSDVRFRDWSAEEIVLDVGGEPAYGFMIIADHRSMTEADSTVLFVDLWDEPGCTFRCSIDQVAAVEANLALSNMDFEEFLDALGPENIFQGFR